MKNRQRSCSGQLVPSRLSDVYFHLLFTYKVGVGVHYRKVWGFVYMLLCNKVNSSVTDIEQTLLVGLGFHSSQLRLLQRHFFCLQLSKKKYFLLCCRRFRLSRSIFFPEFLEIFFRQVLYYPLRF